MKKFLSFVLILTLALSTLGIIPVSAYNPPTDCIQSGDFYYRILSDGSASIVAYTGSDTHLTFPTKIDGFNITEINNPFWQNETIVSLTVPEGIKRASLSTAYNIEELSLPESLEEFNAYSLIDTKFYNDPKNWENHVLYLGNRLLAVDCEKASGTIKVKEDTKYISHSAFFDATKITEIILPDSVVKIEDCAIKYCTSLTKIDLGKGVKYIGAEAFSSCKNLKEISLPEGIKKIEYGTFSESGIEKITFPSSLETIENQAFDSCLNLKSITIPNSVTHLGSAFSFCENLSEINLPDSLDFIGSNVIHATAFAKNPDNYEDGLLYYGNYVLDYINNKDGVYNIKEGTRVVADRLFALCDTLTSVTFPDNVKGVGDAFFMGCDNLEYVKLPSGMKIVGISTFNDCSKLTNITIPDGVTSIGELAFTDCPNLTNIVIPSSVNNIADKSIGYTFVYGDSNDNYCQKIPNAKELIISGYSGSEAERYALINDFNFKDLNTYKYKDNVLEILDIPTEDPETGEGWLARYHEVYEHHSSSEATPDFVLIEVYETIEGPAFAASVFGEYIMRRESHLSPTPFGYVVYIPKTNEVYGLREAYNKNIDGLYSVFTEGIVGELIGDVNYDKKLNIKDVSLIQKDLADIEKISANYIIGYESITPNPKNVPKFISDYNRDGKMNIRDATAIQKSLAGITE